MANKKESPFKIVPLIAAGVSIGTSIFSAISADRAQKDAEEKERLAREEMERLEAAYADLDTSNPFRNLQNQFVGMENTMEDLAINQKQAEFERGMFQQSQANIMEGFRGAAGGSGIAGLAQQLAQQGQIAAQRSAAGIGQQEAANQRAAAQQAANLQLRERQGQATLDRAIAQGDRQTQQMEMGRAATMLGMSQQETAAYMQQGQQAQQAKWSAISSGMGNVTSMLGSYYQGAGANTDTED